MRGNPIDVATSEGAPLVKTLTALRQAAATIPDECYQEGKGNEDDSSDSTTITPQANIADERSSKEKQAEEAVDEASGIDADDLIDRCYVCLDVDEAAVTCITCDKTVCSECLHGHTASCTYAPSTRLHNFFHHDTQGGSTYTNTKDSGKSKQEYTLTDDDRERIAKQKEAALQRRSIAIAQIVQAKRKQALSRKAAIDEAAKQEKRHKTNFEFTDHFEQADPTLDDPGVYEEPKHTEVEHHDEPVEPPAKKRRLTGKQKHQAIRAHTNAVKELVNTEWIKHGEASSRPTVSSTATRRKNYNSTDNLITISNEQRDPRTITSNIPVAPQDEVKRYHLLQVLRLQFQQEAANT